MSYELRKPLIDKLQKSRGSHVITYITSTRSGLGHQMDMGSIRKVYGHLEKLEPKPKDTIIDLFLHTNGGDGTVPWRLVTLIREYCKEFNVIVPYKAFSAGTLTALGANKIYMHRMGMLGPTDPVVSNDFNPPDPNNPQKKIGISVEDVISYISLVKEDVGISHEDELIKAWEFLAGENRIHPLALGNVKRFYAQSRMMAVKLLELHMDRKADEHEIKEIANNLNSKLYFHGHPINRAEALELSLKVEPVSPKIEGEIWDLYQSYEDDMNLETPFNPAFEFKNKYPAPKPLDQDTYQGQIVDVKDLDVVCIESESGSDILRADIRIEGYRQAGNGLFNDKLSFSQTKEKWHSA